MASTTQTEVRRLRMAERAEKQRELYFREVPVRELWDRKRNDGYTTLPRVLPIVMEAIDALEKNHAAGHVYFCLWCRAPDHPFLVIDNPGTFAAEAGYRGDRATDTWRRRMRVLRDAGFIEAKQGPSGEFHYVLLLNPNRVMARLYTDGRVQEGVYNKLVDRSLEVGSYREIEDAMSLDSPAPAVEAAPAAPDPTAEVVAETTGPALKRALRFAGGGAAVPLPGAARKAPPPPRTTRKAPPPPTTRKITPTPAPGILHTPLPQLDVRRTPVPPAKSGAGTKQRRKTGKGQ